MALQDFTISFTTTELVEFNNLSQGNIGSQSTIFADLPTTENIGSQSTVFADLPSFKNIGSQSTIDASGVPGRTAPLGPSPVISSEIIYYGDDGDLNVDEVILSNGAIIRPGNDVESWNMQGQKLNVIDGQGSKTFTVDESRSVITNLGLNSATTWSLPNDADEGIGYTLVRTSSSGSVTVNLSDSIGIIISSSGTLESDIVLDGIGSKVTVTSLGDNVWLVDNAQGVTGTPWDISVITGIDLHLDASDESSITIASGLEVAQWDDLSGGGHHVVGVGANPSGTKPLTGTIISGRNAITFNNDLNQYFINSTAGGTFSAQKGDIYVVLRSTTYPNIPRAIMGSADESVSNKYLYFTHSYSQRTAFGYRNGSPRTDWWTNINHNERDGVQMLKKLSSNGSLWSTKTNGIEEELFDQFGILNPNVGHWFGDSSGRDNFTIGAMFTSAGVVAPFNGEICELIYFDNKNLSATEEAIINVYLKVKWGA